MKVIFGGETKRIPEIKQIDKLLEYAANVFNATHLGGAGNDLKLFYQDDEGDIISVTCQSDLEEAYRIMSGRIKLVFAQDEDKARQSLVKGQPQCNDSFLRSEYIRPSANQSILDRSALSAINSDIGPRQMNPNNMMSLMLEAYLQNQVEMMIRQRTMSGTSMLGLEAQPNQDRLPIEGGPLEEATPVEKIEEVAHEDQIDEQEQNIEEIVNELDQVEEPTCEQAINLQGTQNTAEVVQAQCDNPYLITEEPVRTPCKPKNCACDAGDLCYKCILGKVFSLEPLFENITYQATCIYQPDDFIGVAGADFSANCRFKNTGNFAWPENVQLKLINGTIVVYNALGLDNQSVQPNEELNVTIDLKLPSTPGKYILHFRLVHGDNIEFGDEVTVDLIANEPEPPIVETQQVCSNVRLVDDKLLNELDQPVTETIGNTFYVGQDKSAGDSDDDSIEDLDDKASVNSWIVVHDDDEAADPPGPSEISETEGTASEASKPPDDEPPCAFLTEREVQRNSYNSKVIMSRYDKRFRENLVAMEQEGCLDFEANLSALRRTGNKFDHAVSEVLKQIE